METFAFAVGQMIAILTLACTLHTLHVAGDEQRAVVVRTLYPFLRFADALLVHLQLIVQQRTLTLKPGNYRRGRRLDDIVPLCRCPLG